MIAVRVAESAVDRMAAIHRCADVLEQMRSVQPAYRAAMLAQERSVSSYLGGGVAVPHALDLSFSLVRRDAVAVLRFPEGVDWAGRPVFLCVAIAAASDGQHVETLAAVAEILLDPIRAAALRAAEDPDEIIRLFCR